MSVWGASRPTSVEMTDMSDVLHAAAGATGEAAMAGDTRTLTAVGAALQVLAAGAERIAVLGAIEHAAAVVAKLGSPATQRALRRVLAEIDACSRAGTHTSVSCATPGSRAAWCARRAVSGVAMMTLGAL